MRTRALTASEMNEFIKNNEYKPDPTGNRYIIPIWENKWGATHVMAYEDEKGYSYCDLYVYDEVNKGHNRIQQYSKLSASDKKLVQSLIENAHGEKPIGAKRKAHLSTLKVVYSMRQQTKSLEKKRPVNKPLLKKGSVVKGKDGKFYEVTDPEKRKVRRIKSLADIPINDMEIGEVSFTVYQRYLKDRFAGEDCPIKKGKLYFRDYRMKFDNEKGFVIEDTRNNYATVDTPFKEIPTPRQLGDWFEKPVKEITPADMQKAKLNGENLERSYGDYDVEVDSIEDLRNKALYRIQCIREKIDTTFDPMDFKGMFESRKWKVRAGKILKQWKEKKMRYPRMLSMLEELIKDDVVFGLKEEHKMSEFVGTMLPACKEVGLLKGDKIEVDGKLIPAVPFIQNYLLHYEPKVMPQLMKYAAGEITAEQLIHKPIAKDKTAEFNSKLLKNSAEVAKVLSNVCVSVGLFAPQDLLFTDELKIGDQIMLFIDGKWSKQTITDSDFGVCYGNEYGIMKFDKWYKI